MASSYSIGKHFEELIEGLIESGRYTTASEVMREGLRLVEEREERRKAKLEALRAEIQKGLDSGPAEEVGDMFERSRSEGRQALGGQAWQIGHERVPKRRSISFRSGHFIAADNVKSSRCV